jgi:hypothetical protein
MSALVDENALAQRVLTILAESLLGAGVRRPAEPATNYSPEAASRAAAAEPALSISAFCQAEGMSRSTYYKLRRRGLGPEVTEVVLPAAPGEKGLMLVRISADAHRQWREKIAQMRASEAAELEAARAHAQRVAAAKLAAASPAHVSRRPRPVRRRRPRRE